MPLPCYSCVHVLVLLISCDSAAASQLDEEATVLTDKEKLAKLHGEGLDDVDDFMDSFGRGQLATDDVKCDLCKHLLFDLNAGVSNLRADGVAEGDPTQVKDIAIMERTELNIRALCDTRVPRFLGLYHIYDCQEEKDEIAACRPELLRRPGRAPKRYSIQREANPKMRMEDMERSTDRWEGDAHTIMCAHYWTPLAEAIGEAIGEFDGGSGSESEAMAAVAEMAQEFCTENEICTRDKKKSKKKKNKKAKKDKPEKSKGTGKGKGKANTGETTEDRGPLQAALRKKRELIEQARKQGMKPEQLREKMFSDEFDEKLAAARARSEKRKAGLR